jgi:tetratricopeptide (TPR) repeat protein
MDGRAGVQAQRFPNMSPLVTVVPPRLKRAGWIALGAIVAAAIALPPLLTSRFVAERRAALAVQRARAHQASREFDRARTELRAALRLQPDRGEARHQLARMELALSNWELAFLELETLTELHPQDPDGWIGLAGLMVKTGLLAAPEAALDKAIAVAPNRADARVLRADVRLRLGRYHGAHLDAQAAVAHGTADAEAWSMLVRSAARSQGAEAGIEAARRGLAAAGRDPALLLPLASLLAEAGRTLEATAVQDEIGSAGGSSGHAWNVRLAIARGRLRAGDRDAAGKQLDALLQERPADEDALVLRALLEAERGRVEGALARLEEALASLPMSHALRDVLARLQSADSDRRAVATLLAEWSGKDFGPSPVPSSRIRAESLSSQGIPAGGAREHWPGRLAQIRHALETQMRQQNWTEAVRIVESARRGYPDTAFASFLAGILELARGIPGEAERHLSEARRFAPRSPVVAMALAKAWSRQKGAAFAGERLMELGERDPGFAFARLLAARAFIDGRDPSRAEAAVRRGLELQPQSPLPYRHLADFFLELDRSADGLHSVQRGLEAFPQDVDLQVLHAQISADFGRAADAIRFYEGILSRRPDLDVVEYRLAALLASQEGEAASQRLRPILQNLQLDAPSDPSLLACVGWAHHRAGNIPRARAALEAAVSAAPDEPGPRFQLAAIYLRERKVDLARTQLGAALDSKRRFPERLEAMRLMRELSSAPAPNASATSAGQ